MGKNENVTDNTDICAHSMIGLAPRKGATVNQNEQLQAKRAKEQTKRRMAPRHSKRIVKKEEGTHNTRKKRGR